jgi:hypothetical protein
MQAQEIEPKLWGEFCEKFSTLNRGSIMSIETLRPDGRKDEIAQDIPFGKMTLDTTDACNDILSITLGEAGQRRITHEVIEPIHFRVEQDNGGHKVLQLEAENGVTLVHFHSGRVPELVPNLKSYNGNRMPPDRNGPPSIPS